MQCLPPYPVPASIAAAYSLNVSRTDRWLVYHRLQELQINAWCLADGSLWAEVPSPIIALLIRSVVQQILAPRQDLVHWLDRCWEMQPRVSVSVPSHLSPGGA